MYKPVHIASLVLLQAKVCAMELPDQTDYESADSTTASASITDSTEQSNNVSSTGELLGLSLRSLSQIKISVASNLEETLELAPSSVTVFTREEIKRIGLNTLEELYNYVPGFQSSINVRGNARMHTTARGRNASHLGNDILVMIDGQRINDSSSGGAENYTPYLSLHNIRQIEIIRGPGSALYGSNAFLGVVNIVSETESNEATVTAGSFDTAALDLHLSGEEDWFNYSVFARGSGDNGDSYEDSPHLFGVENNTQDPRKMFDFHLKLTRNNSELAIRHQQRQQEDFYSTQSIADGITKSESSQTTIDLRHQFELTDQFTMTGYLGAVETIFEDELLLQPESTSPPYLMEPGGGPFLHGPLIGGQHLENYNYYTGLNFQYRASKRLHLSSGLLYEKTGNKNTGDRLNYNTRVEQDLSVAFNGFPYFGRIVQLSGKDSWTKNASRSVFGLYGQVKYQFTDRLHSIMGARYDHYSDFGDSLNPRTALVYAAPDYRLKLMYGEAFRAPTLEELNNQNFETFLIPSSLDAEKVKTLEFQVAVPTQFTQTTVTLFRNEISDKITSIESDNPVPLPTFDNVGTQTIRGWEAEFDLLLLNGFSLRSAYTNIVDEGDAGVAEEFASLIANYRTGQLNLNLNGIYRGDMADVDDAGHFVIGNFTASFQLRPQTELGFRVLNFTDEDYLSYNYIGEQPAGIQNRGRAWYLDFRMQF